MPKPTGSANEFIEQELDARVAPLEDRFGADVITFCGGLFFSVDDILRAAVERKFQERPKRNKLVIVLTTGGGYIEVVQRIVDVLRRFYKLVDFVVPSYAYSAGTILAMSGDAIHMDYYSRLGPIDPQVQNRAGRQVPALGYLERYDELIKKAQNGTISTAEVQLIIDGFDQAELYKYQHERELSIALLKLWLVKYKFKNWKITRTRGLPVTRKMKGDRAEEIARKLNDTRKWHTHGHGISMDVLERDVNVLIDDFGKDPNLSEKIRAYHDLLSDYMVKRGATGVIHFKGHYRPFM